MKYGKRRTWTAMAIWIKMRPRSLWLKFRRLFRKTELIILILHNFKRCFICMMRMEMGIWASRRCLSSLRSSLMTRVRVKGFKRLRNRALMGVWRRLMLEMIFQTMMQANRIFKIHQLWNQMMRTYHSATIMIKRGFRRLCSQYTMINRKGKEYWKNLTIHSKFT